MSDTDVWEDDATMDVGSWGDEWGSDDAKTERDGPILEFDTVYPAQIYELREIRDLPRRADKPPTKVISYGLRVLVPTHDNGEMLIERKLRDVWIMGSGKEPADYSSLFWLAKTCMGEQLPTNGDGLPVLDDEHSVSWWTQAVVGHPLRVKTRRGKKYTNKKSGEEKVPMEFMIDSPWEEGREM